MWSQSRQELFLSFPSLNTCLNERLRIFSDEQIELLSQEMEQVFNTNKYIETHTTTLGASAESGVSLRKLVGYQITIVKLPDIE